MTSPDTISLHKNLNYLKRKKIDNVIIEASSHGLHQKRLHHINFKSAIFTNFTQDHLDYHKSMKSYLNAKLILFKKILKKNSVIISDKEIKPFNLIKKISKIKQLKLKDINHEIDKTKNFLPTSSDFKIKNFAMAIIAARICGLKDQSIYSKIKKVKDVNGRLELVKKYPNNIKAFVDYAHTPDALLKTLSFLKNTYKKDISLVFGCGGNRDKKKRSFMAKIANNYCKNIYVTDDNPRDESPKKIRKELLKYISPNKSFDIGNRSLAIKRSIQNARPNEIILIAGKGHEENQIYKDKIYNISDKKIIRKIHPKFKKIPAKKINLLENQLIMKKILKKINGVNFNGLSTDTRLIKKGNLFLAIKGKKNNGNKYINEAFKKGAACVVTESDKNYKKKIFKVKKFNFFFKFIRKI